MGFVEVRAGVNVPGCALPPILRQLLNDPLHGLGVFLRRSEIESFGKSRAVGLELLCKGQVAA